MQLDVSCALCGTTDDVDEFIIVRNRHYLCRNCRTCPHGHAHYEQGPSDVCYACVRQLFTVETLWGAFISNIDEYIAYADASGMDPTALSGWSWDETERIQSQAVENWKAVGVPIGPGFPPPWHATS